MKSRSKKQVIWLREVITERPYTITAKLSKATGLVLQVSAGCRTWNDFTEALAHYAGGGRYEVGHWEIYRFSHTSNSAETIIGRRDRSMLALARLAARVYDYQQRKRR